jgi:hypothetical protein
VTAFADAVLAEVARPLEDRRVVRLVCSRGHTIDRVVLAGHVPSWDPGALPSVYLHSVSPPRKRSRRTRLSRAYAPLGGTFTMTCAVPGCERDAVTLDLLCEDHDTGAGPEMYSQRVPNLLRCPAEGCRFRVERSGPALAEDVAHAILAGHDRLSLGVSATPPRRAVR